MGWNEFFTMVWVLWKIDWQFLKELRELPYDTAIPVLDKILQGIETDIQIKIYT